MASGWKEVAPRQSPSHHQRYATEFIAACAGAAYARGLKGLRNQPPRCKGAIDAFRKSAVVRTAAGQRNFQVVPDWRSGDTC